MFQRVLRERSLALSNNKEKRQMFLTIKINLLNKKSGCFMLENFLFPDIIRLKSVFFYRLFSNLQSPSSKFFSYKYINPLIFIEEYEVLSKCSVFLIQESTGGTGV
jgi:hypothetical protein